MRKGFLRTARKRGALFLTGLLLLGGLSQYAFAASFYQFREDRMEISTQSVLLYNTDLDFEVYSKNADVLLQPASTIKIMTAVLAMENTEDLDADRFVYSYDKINGELAGSNATAADVRPGEEVTMRMALYCLLMQSDAYSALGIAEHIGGKMTGSDNYEENVARFVEMMNEKAQQLGMVNTVIKNPHGLYAEGQQTTAYDLLQLTKHAMKLEGFMEICSTSVLDMVERFGPTNKHGEGSGWRLITTVLPMLNGQYYYEPIKGIKTGSLDEVGRNYIAYASKDGMNYVLILLGAPWKDEEGAQIDPQPIFVDAKNLLNWAFEMFTVSTLVEKNSVQTATAVRLGKDVDKVDLVAADNLTALVPIGTEFKAQGGDAAKDIVPVWDYAESVDAPVKRGAKIGTLRLMLNGNVLGEVDLLAKDTIQRSSVKYMLDWVKNLFGNFWVKFAVVLAVLLLAFYITLMVLRNRYRNRYRRARGRRK